MSEVRIRPVGIGTRLTLRCGCVLLDDAGTTVLVDPGHFSGDRAALDAALHAAAGIGLDDIDIVFFTHLHFDHYDDLGYGPRTTVAVSARELEFFARFIAARDDGEGVEAFLAREYEHLAPVFRRQFVRLAHDRRYDFANASFAGRLRTVAPGEALTPNLRVIDLEGHAPGQIGLDCRTAHGRTAIAGDALLSLDDALAADVAHHLVYWRHDLLLAARESLAGHDCVVPGHGPWFEPRSARLIETTEGLLHG